VGSAIQRTLLITFRNTDDLIAGERLLKERTKGTKTTVVRLRRGIPEHLDPSDIVHVRTIDELRTWLRRSSRRVQPTNLLLCLKTEFDTHRLTRNALNSMDVQLSNVLSSGQDQIVVLDREQRMVAFFGHWPEESPRRPRDLLGKRKRDIFGPEAAAVHEAAALRALNGEDAVYEWSVTDLPRPIHLFTAASPLRSDKGVIAGIVLVTRNITSLKQALFETEKALADKRSQLLDVERGVKQIADSLQRSPQGKAKPLAGSSLHTKAFLSAREHEVLNLLRKGVRLRSIGQTLGISIETVRRHVKTMFRKTGVHSQEALVRLFYDGT
jgi:DNA-binding CsgD family transcriptional regulator/PAS domain-containing protein